MDYVYGDSPGCLAGVLRGNLAETVATSAADGVQHQDGYGDHRHPDGVDHDRLVVERRIHFAPVHRMPQVSK